MLGDRRISLALGGVCLFALGCGPEATLLPGALDPVRIAVGEALAPERTAVVKTPEWERAWRDEVHPCIVGC